MKDIEGYGNYQITEDGRVWSKERIATLHGAIFTIGNQWLIPTYLKIGYFTVKLSKRVLYIHRLVATAYIPNPNKYRYVNHLDGVKTNNHVTNLEWCTASHNNFHKSRTLKKNRGELVGGSILTEQKVIDIYNKFATGEYTKTQLGKEYGVSRQAVYDIVNRRRWMHILGYNQPLLAAHTGPTPIATDF